MVEAVGSGSGTPSKEVRIAHSGEITLEKKGKRDGADNTEVTADE